MSQFLSSTYLHYFISGLLKRQAIRENSSVLIRRACGAAVVRWSDRRHRHYVLQVAIEQHGEVAFLEKGKPQAPVRSGRLGELLLHHRR